MKKIFFLLLILFFALMWSACSRNEQTPAAWQRPEVGGIAPDFSLKALNGRNVNLSDFKGHVVVLDFWATWCPPCQATIPELVSVEDKYRDKGVVVLGIAIDDGRNIAAKLSAFSKEHKMNYSILLGSDAVEDRYDIRSIPTMFLIDKSGRIRDLHMGYTEDFQRTISAEIDRLI